MQSTVFYECLVLHPDFSPCCPLSTCASCQAHTLRSACASYGAQPELSRHAGLDAK